MKPNLPPDPPRLARGDGSSEETMSKSQQIRFLRALIARLAAKVAKHEHHENQVWEARWITQRGGKHVGN